MLKTIPLSLHKDQASAHELTDQIHHDVIFW